MSCATRTRGELALQLACAQQEEQMLYRIVDDETGKELHRQFPRTGALMWAAGWCDLNEYNKIEIDDKTNTILVSRGSITNDE